MLTATVAASCKNRTR
ncbi:MULTISPECIES: Vmc-like lipoprotein signal peptide domain-containing protein [Gordonibacter]